MTENGFDSETLTETEPDPRAASEPTAITIGARIDRFVVIEELGQGGMGVVFKAYDPKLDRRLAIKLVSLPSERIACWTERRARLMREAQALAKLSHPNVIAVYDVGTFGNDVFLAMELVEGMTLRQWLLDSQPGYRQILTVMLAAGEGLSAAHQAGLVHRDFKPDNILIGADGRVRVIDFGLARAAGGEVGRSGSEEGRSGDGSVSGPIPCPSGEVGGLSGEAPQSPLSSSLTRTGAVMGTPLYMSPEQHLGQEVDARADQYGFCLVLYEALYGKRPFSGRTKRELVLAKTKETLDEPPDRSEVPAHALAVLARGLRRSPAERFSSMAELLATLQNDPRRRWRRLMTTLGVLLLAIAAILGGVAVLQTRSLRCRGARARIEEVWTPSTRARVRAGFESTGLPYARNAWMGVEQTMGGFITRWSTLYEQTCEATFIWGEQSERLLDRKMDCLRQQLDKVKALLALFGQKPEKKTVERALDGMIQATALDHCASDTLLDSPLALPAETLRGKKAEGIHRQLIQVEALELAGKYEEGLALASELATLAHEVKHKPLQAEVVSRLGSLQEKNGQFAEAEQSLRMAIRDAAEGQHLELAARTWTDLLYVIGYRQARYDVALSLVPAVEFAMEVARSSARVRAELDNRLGAIYLEKGELEKSRERFARFLSFLQGAAQASAGELSNAHSNLGLVLLHLGRTDEALGHLSQALQIGEGSLGPDHPVVANVLINQGLAYLQRGQYTQAEGAFRRALAIDGKCLGARHPDLAGNLGNLGLALMGQDRLAEARPIFAQSLTIMEEALGAEHPNLARVLAALGKLETQAKEYDRAKRYLERVLALREQHFGPKHPEVGETFQALGSLFVARGERAKGAGYLKRAIAIFRISEEPDPHLLDTLDELGLLWLGQGVPDKARRVFAEAIQVATRGAGIDRSVKGALQLHLGKACLADRLGQQAQQAFQQGLDLCQEEKCLSDPALVPLLQFGLACALEKLGSEPQRSRELARQARKTLAGMADQQEALGEIDRWLKGR